MTDTAMRNALILGAGALILWSMTSRYLSRRRAQDTRTVPPPFMASPPCSLEKREDDGVGKLLKKLYGRKTKFRLGVLACSLLALVAYVWGQSRSTAIIMLLLAVFFQYGVYRHRTATLLTETLQRRKTASDKEDLTPVKGCEAGTHPYREMINKRFFL